MASREPPGTRPSPALALALLPAPLPPRIACSRRRLGGALLQRGLGLLDLLLQALEVALPITRLALELLARYHSSLADRRVALCSASAFLWASCISSAAAVRAAAMLDRPRRGAEHPSHCQFSARARADKTINRVEPAITDLVRPLRGRVVVSAATGPE